MVFFTITLDKTTNSKNRRQNVVILVLVLKQFVNVINISFLNAMINCDIHVFASCWFYYQIGNSISNIEKKSLLLRSTFSSKSAIDSFCTSSSFCFRIWPAFRSFFLKNNDILQIKDSKTTVNSRKSRTLFINYDFRWLMVAEIY